MVSLILAGEAVFVPIYHLNRYFKSSFEAAFGITTSQIGTLFVWFGLVSMACYLLGGPLADRFSPRKLLTGSLLATAAGGLYMATLPSFVALQWLFAFWGASAILLFWAPLMRATREWGGEAAQGRAFGLLDGGRGLISALIASAAALLYAGAVGDEESPDTQANAIRLLMGFYSACCVVAAASVWAFLPTSPAPGKQEDHEQESAMPRHASSFDRFLAVARLPAVWLQAIIILTAYVAFRGFDNYGDYAEVAYGLDAAQSAKLAAGLSYLRAFAALGAGWVADRLLGVANTIALGFLTLIACFTLLLFTPTDESYYYLAVGNMAVSAVAFFGLRGIYFAMFEESGVPRALTGMAVGVVSFIGYTPDLFFPKVYGWLVTSAKDAGNEMLGYQRLFLLLAIVSAIGLVASQALRWLGRKSA